MDTPVLTNLRSLLLALLLSTLSACRLQPPTTNSPASPFVQASDTNPSCKIVNHVWGANELCKQPQRIIALDPHALDLLLSLGIQPIGYAEDSHAVVGSPELGHDSR